MNISDIINHIQKPKLYEKGTAFMWDDAYISKQILDIHLHPEIDLGSRKKTSIEKTVNWIMNQFPNQQLKILDLGCGPGLYTELYARQGHQVYGVDISANSIEYAIRSAKNNHLNIQYTCANYLDLDMEAEQFDLVTMIFTDLGVLNPQERDTLLKLIHKVLKKGGNFIFDLLSDKDLTKKVSPKSWECQEKGFWKPYPYLALSESFLYEEEKVILYQHHVIGDEKSNVYRFWTHFYSHDKIRSMLKAFNFNIEGLYNNILPEGDLWNGEHVTFTKAIKS